MESLKNSKFEVLKDSELVSSKGGRWKYIRSYGEESGCTANVYQEIRWFKPTSNTQTTWTDD